MKALIAFVTVAALAAVIGAVVVGSRSFEGIVTEKPYEAGIAWDKTLHEKTASGWDAVITDEGFSTGDAGLPIRLLEGGDKALTNADVLVIVSRPSTTAYDREYRAVETDKGLYTAMVHFPLYGYWDIKIHVLRDKKKVSFDKRIYISEKGETR